MNENTLARIAIALERLCDHFIDPEVEEARRRQKWTSERDAERAAVTSEKLCPGYGTNPWCAGVKSPTAKHCWKCVGLTRKGL